VDDSAKKTKDTDKGNGNMTVSDVYCLGPCFWLFKKIKKQKKRYAKDNVKDIQ
jgi:hypothetical protein